MRRLCWDWQPVDGIDAATAAVEDFLRGSAARQWQRELTVPVLAKALSTAG